MPSKLRLSKRTVDALAPAAKDVVWFDGDLPGFGVKVTPGGRKVFVFQYRFPSGRTGTTRRYTIGTYTEALTPDQARSIATRLRGKLADGIDPMAEKEKREQAERDAIAAKKRETKETVGSFARLWMDRHVRPRNRSADGYESLLRNHVLPKWQSRSILSIRRADVAELLDGIEQQVSAATADATLRVVRAMFNWYALRDDRFVNPIVRGMNRTSARAAARDRTLTDMELGAVWTAMDGTPYPFGPMFKLLLLTAQRRDEVAQMRWSEIEADLWTIPGSRYKTGKSNVVPLTAAAQAILRSVPRIRGAGEGEDRAADFIFTTTGRTPVSGFSRAKAALDATSGVKNWRIHDLRRTARSLMSRAGIRGEIAERVLGHAIPGIAGVYDRHDYLSEKREALALLERQLVEILEERSGGTTKRQGGSE